MLYQGCLGKNEKIPSDLEKPLGLKRKRKKGEPKPTTEKPFSVKSNFTGHKNKYPVKLDLRENVEYHFTIAGINCDFKTPHIYDSDSDSEIDPLYDYSDNDDSNDESDDDNYSGWDIQFWAGILEH